MDNATTVTGAGDLNDIQYLCEQCGPPYQWVRLARKKPERKVAPPGQDELPPF